MKKFAILSITISVAIALIVSGVLAQSSPPAPGSATPPASQDQNKPAAAAPARDQDWLKQLVGEWDVQFKINMQPDQPPMETTGTDSVRALGEYWIIADTKTTMMGAPYNGILSLGYNALTKQFNGTWIDSFGGHLWVYKGTLNEAGDTMTLETEGPSLQVPDKTARYKEVIQFTGKDTRTFTSNMENADGTWMKILTIEYRRKKS